MTKLTELMVLADRGVPGAFEAACALGQEISDKESTAGKRIERANAKYQIYKNDKLIMTGKVKTIAKKYDVRIETVLQWTAASYVEKAKQEGRKYAVMLKTQK